PANTKIRKTDARERLASVGASVHVRLLHFARASPSTITSASGSSFAIVVAMLSRTPKRTPSTLIAATMVNTTISEIARMNGTPGINATTLAAKIVATAAVAIVPSTQTFDPTATPD